MSVWTIVVAAGRGDRFGGPKQLANLAGATVLDRTVATARRMSDGGVVVVLAADAHDRWRAPDGVRTATGGATRSASVRAGLAAVDDATVDVVLVHDAARPLATPMLYRAVIDAVRHGADAAVPGIPVADTLKRVADGHVVETVPRDQLVAVQTPQGFAIDALRRAHADGGDDTDDAALVEASGGRVAVVSGEVRNFKITTPADLELAASLLEVG